MKKIAAIIFFCTSLFIIIKAFALNLANPAAVNCTNKGYRYLMIQNIGLCLFPDNSYCEEWAFFRGTCKPGDPGSNSDITKRELKNQLAKPSKMFDNSQHSF